MFCTFYSAKSHKTAISFASTEAIENITTDLESLEFLKNVGVCLTKYEHYQILFHKISNRFLVTAKLFKVYLHVSLIFQ
jgi:hypothetical protein